jgi:hypothetical protein
MWRAHAVLVCAFSLVTLLQEASFEVLSIAWKDVSVENCTLNDSQSAQPSMTSLPVSSPITILGHPQCQSLLSECPRSSGAASYIIANLALYTCHHTCLMQ